MTRVDVLTAGETMMALRATGPVRLGSGFTAGIAGAESNVAIGLGGSATPPPGRDASGPTRPGTSSPARCAPRGSTPRPSTATPPRPPA
ncbi:hypothetical protein LUX57_48895 [Actinomadura madurae]|uniref:hypothetical protein n=1 Tax=Actinomadura madurae TaxID=1993 RepID=UPI0020D21575|nr:hypothetical protein [Actinomadura madurae]MCP9972035.1 hypothetical protein [Actinomadura madurae]